MYCTYCVNRQVLKNYEVKKYTFKFLNLSENDFETMLYIQGTGSLTVVHKCREQSSRAGQLNTFFLF